MPFVALKDQVLFPGVTLPVYFASPAARRALATARREERLVFAGLLRAFDGRPGDRSLSLEGLLPVGTVAEVLQVSPCRDGGVRAVLRGRRRARWTRLTRDGRRIEVRPIPDGRSAPTGPRGTDRSPADPDAGRARGLLGLFARYVRLEPRLDPAVGGEARSLRKPGRIVEFMEAHLLVPLRRRQDLLQASEPEERVALLEGLLRKEVRRLSRGGRKVRGESVSAPEPAHPGGRDDAEDLLRRAEALEAPEAIRSRAVREATRLLRLPPLSPEGAVVRSYLEWLLALPWTERTEDRTDIPAARAVLDTGHEGLEPVKERILEAVAVLKKTKRLPPTVLALVGPPGVGKTSLGRAVAAVLGRSFARISLGGLRDEAEIRGHRRTYVGAMPGRILAAMRRAGTVNPVLLLDEIDKVGADQRGDPAGALLEVLDPEQNHAFSDHYLEADYDLRQVLFLVTANSVHDIPYTLRDRLEVLTIPGYHEGEKVRIAKNHLVPRLESQHGLPPGTLGLGDEDLRRIVREHTREAGVRHLERQLARLCRKAAVREAGGASARRKATWEEDLGPAPNTGMDPDLEGEPGRALALGVTSVGGEVLPVEVVLLPGRGRVRVTGGAGAMLKDSVRAVLTCARSRGAVSPSASWDVHVHLPGGGMMKDGPSAGAAIYAAVVSAFRDVPTRGRVALTGEVTLRGRVLPVGGLREKLLAARRAGITTVLVPAGQDAEPSLLPPEIRKHLRIVPVSDVSQLEAKALARRRSGRAA